jgi:hypothetical protein
VDIALQILGLQKGAAMLRREDNVQIDLSERLRHGGLRDNERRVAISDCDAMATFESIRTPIGNPFRVAINILFHARYPGRRCACPGLCSETPSA